MRFIEGVIYYSPMEAGMYLGVSPRTLQRWADSGHIRTRAKSNGNHVEKEIDLHAIRTPTGYRYYSKQSVESLALELRARPIRIPNQELEKA